jgi:cytochrome c nitrite reductase small subunit
MPDDMPRANGPGVRLRAWVGLLPIWILLAFAGLAGGLTGLGGFTFSYAQGLSYLSNDPRACANCHVMRDVYDGWSHGSHKAVAACNDCHTPHPIVAKYAIKALDGFKHSAAFTLGGFHEPIEITPLDRQIVQSNCLNCHGDMTAEISHVGEPNPTDCLHCHAGVGHGR